jgi:hypothetical protein
VISFCLGCLDAAWHRIIQLNDLRLSHTHEYSAVLFCCVPVTLNALLRLCATVNAMSQQSCPRCAIPTSREAFQPNLI